MMERALIISLKLMTCVLLLGRVISFQFELNGNKINPIKKYNRHIRLFGSSGRLQNALGFQKDPDDRITAVKLTIKDLNSILTLAVEHFGPNCQSEIEICALKFDIFRFFTPKLLFPNFMGHTILGLKTAANNINDKLIAFVDLSKQPYTGTLDALKYRPLLQRQITYQNNLKPYISNLLVDPEYRRGGLGSKIIRECEKLALQWGFKDIYLHVETTTIPALRLYIKNDFIVEEVVKKDIYFMHKVIKTKSSI